MKYDISLKISYHYDTLSDGGRHILRMLPKEINGVQRVIASAYHIVPRPVEFYSSQDFFGTPCAEILLEGQSKKIEFGIKTRVERTAPIQDFSTSLSYQDLCILLATMRDLMGASPLHFVAPSARVSLHPAISDYARAMVAPEYSVLDIVRNLGEALHHDMAFDPEATDVNTPLIEAFTARHGVCQDYSHIMIAALRGIGIPAGYVSGFLRTIPPEGKPALEGADAMHAWVSAWCGPQLGWVDYDPTNRMFVHNDHIVIGSGRDYADLSPVIGSIRTAGGQKSKQSVTVKPLA